METGLAEPRPASSATTTDFPKAAAIALADVSSRPTNPLGQAIIPTEAETRRLCQLSKRPLSSPGDRISSAQKWLTDETGISIHGLLNFGTNYNFNQPATGNNLYRVFDYFGASGFEPNQAELYLNRSMPNQPGFVVDLNFLNTAEVMHGLTSYYGDHLDLIILPGGWIRRRFINLHRTNRKGHQFVGGPPG